MSTGLFRSWGMVVSSVVLFGAPRAAWACATCFGKSDEAMAKGMNMGIFTLLVIILAVLMAIAVFFLYITRRAAKLQAAGMSFTESGTAALAGRTVSSSH